MSKLEQVTERLWDKHIAPDSSINRDGYVVLNRQQFTEALQSAAQAGVEDAKLE